MRSSSQNTDGHSAPDPCSDRLAKAARAATAAAANEAGSGLALLFAAAYAELAEQ